MILEDEADEHSQLKYMAGMFGKMLGDEERAEIQGHLPYGKAIDA